MKKFTQIISEIDSEVLKFRIIMIISLIIAALVCVSFVEGKDFSLELVGKTALIGIFSWLGSCFAISISLMEKNGVVH